MGTEPVWLPGEALIDAHARKIEQHGGLPGLRDREALESAAARARQQFSYSTPEPTVVSLAAAYGWGFCRGHAFNDGNKRIGFIAMFVFLDMNGYNLDAREQDAHDVMRAVADGSMTESELPAWAERHSFAK
jgi:death on curing protein